MLCGAAVQLLGVRGRARCVRGLWQAPNNDSLCAPPSIDDILPTASPLHQLSKVASMTTRRSDTIGPQRTMIGMSSAIVSLLDPRPHSPVSRDRLAALEARGIPTLKTPLGPTGVARIETKGPHFQHGRRRRRRLALRRNLGRRRVQRERCNTARRDYLVRYRHGTGTGTGPVHSLAVPLFSLSSSTSLR